MHTLEAEARPPLRQDPFLWAALVIVALMSLSSEVGAQPTPEGTTAPPRLELKRLKRPEPTCPVGYKCLTDAQAEELSEIVENHNCMIDAAQRGDIRMELEEQRVVVTTEGQVLTDDKLTGELHWCRWQLGFTADNEVAVTKQKPEPEPDWGLRLRVKLGFVWLPTQVGLGVGEMFDPVLVFEPFHWRMLHVQAHGGLQQAGLSLGVDVTGNLDLFGGAAVEYTTGDMVPVFGLSLSFN